MKTKLALSALALALLGGGSLAHAANNFSDGMIYRGAGAKLFSVGEVNGHNGFRIPAIASAGNGVLIAAADVRYMGSDWSDLVAGTAIRKTKISTKVSFDGGKHWTDLNVLNASNNPEENHYENLATDPALVFDKKSNTALMFGLRNNVNLQTGLQNNNNNNPNTPQGNPDGVIGIPAIGDHKPDFIMFTSNDKGLNWEAKSIYKDVKDQVNKGNTGGGAKKYSIIFQGPGGGMVYNNKIYVPIQAWATKKDTGADWVATSGFMVSEDGGENWKVSSMLIPNIADKIDQSDKTLKSSESNIFHYKGKIRLAVRNEESGKNPSGNKGVKLRLVYEYDDAHDKWTEVQEDFIPKDVAQVETSSHNLNEDVYLVGYTSYYNYNFNNNPDRRKGQYITTNTGIKLLLSDNVSEGYTSITSDDDNIYVMYEGKIDQHDIFFKAIDWKHKEYANINTQLLRRAHTANYFQNQMSGHNESYALGGANTAGGNIEVMGYHNGFKGGVFVKHDRDLDEDYADALSYKNTDFAALLGYETQFNDQAKGNVFFGYMQSKIEYDNGSENKVDSILGGVQLDCDFGAVAYRGAFNAMFSDNSLQRNNNEGLGKTANYDSYSFSLTNEVIKGLEFKGVGNVELSAGLNNVFFGHDGFREVGGEGIGEGGLHGANNALIGKSNNTSHEVFVKAAFESKPVEFGSDGKMVFKADAKYAYDLADSDDWFEDFRTMSVNRSYKDIGELYAAHDGGYLKTNAGVDITVYKSLTLGLKGSVDSVGNVDGGANLSFTF